MQPGASSLGILALAIGASSGFAGQDSLEVPFRLSRLSSRVIVLDCLNVNVTAISGRDGLVVIDTNRSTGVMRRLRRVIEDEFGRHDFISVINTHADEDHSSGNPVFDGIPLIAQEGYGAFVRHGRSAALHRRWGVQSRLRAAQERYREIDRASAEAESLRGVISILEMANADLREGDPPMLPSTTFRDSLRLDLGDLTLELRYLGDAHTTHDIVVYVPEEKLLVTGDLICSPQSPCFPIDALTDAGRIADGIDALLRREAGLETIVPGHGRLLSREDLTTFCRSISNRYAQVEVQHSAARVLRDAIESDGIRAALQRCPPPTPGAASLLRWSQEEFSTLGTRLLRRGKADEAVQALRLATRVLPESPLLFARLGDANLELDDRDAAAAAYRRSVALEPANRYADEMLRAMGAAP